MTVVKRIMPGELFVVEYVNGGFVNRWAINASKDYIELGAGRKAASGFTDVLAEPDSTSTNLIDSRFHVLSNAGAIKYVSDPTVSLGTQEFAEIPLQVLKVVKQTEIYDRYGALLGTVPAGTLIGTDTGAAGNSNRHLMVANAYNDGSGWKFVNQTTYSYGFVNMQKNHSLERFNSNKAIETAISGVAAPIDWNLVRTQVTTTAPEVALRGDLTAATKEEVVALANDHFASIDLKTVDNMDPVAFFMNAKNKAFTEKRLELVDAVKAADFKTVADAFVAQA